MTDTMRALVSGIGPDWVLREVPRPQPKPGQILIRNLAAATNNADLPMLAAADPTHGGHGNEFIAGFEYAGDVVALGDGVHSWRIGDQVMGSIPSSFADYVVADQRFVLPRPDGLDPAVACALPTGLLTEHGALAVAGFTAGQSMLITGASTGIGLIGVQLAKALGASHVIGTTRTAAKRELLAEAGVDTVIVTDEQDLTEATLDATDRQGVDVVLDHIAGPTFAHCLPATKVDGHVVNIGRLAGPAATIDLDALSYRHLTVHGVSFGFTRDQEMADVIAALLPEVIPAVARGQIRPVIDRTVDLAEFRQAADRLRSGEAVGKIVIRMTDG
ncbi:quinone oxidoreductase family protein [Nocardia caishijiensis]|uniref:NADPH:quinone reductase-like Zn-dependent oxidoreductase n=1 Tax=Nocardia caishijiensis TaxID=184756 RepID=A0ABQ6YLL8_9NOCA|nr:zinc-binding dehydrogenase [Nocardia caishijiensis]KAF0846687.1 NADPH:quinone reductase-like Zn-dependent oxidoreductase [Nocardia caishijiensis]